MSLSNAEGNLRVYLLWFGQALGNFKRIAPNHADIQVKQPILEPRLANQANMQANRANSFAVHSKDATSLARSSAN